MFLLRRAFIMGGLCSLLLLLAGFFLASCKQPTPITISIVYSSEKKAWLEPLLNEYNQLQSRISVKGYWAGSVESVRIRSCAFRAQRRLAGATIRHSITFNRLQSSAIPFIGVH